MGARLSLVGTVVGCFALAAAVLPTWLRPIFVPPEPLDQVVMEMARKSGLVHQESAPHLEWPDLFADTAATLGFLAIALGACSWACSFFAGEPRRQAATPFALGCGAILFEEAGPMAVSLIIVSVLIDSALHRPDRGA